MDGALSNEGDAQRPGVSGIPEKAWCPIHSAFFAKWVGELRLQTDRAVKTAQARTPSPPIITS